MNPKTNKRMALNAVTLILIPTFVAATWTLVSASVRQTSGVLVAQSQPISQEKQQIAKAILLADSQRNGGDNTNIAPERVDRIAIAGPYALASVLIGEHGGGVAVLSKNQSSWQVIGGGGGWLILSDLEALGIARDLAEDLLEGLDPNWRNYEP